MFDAENENLKYVFTNNKRIKLFYRFKFFNKTSCKYFTSITKKSLIFINFLNPFFKNIELSVC